MIHSSNHSYHPKEYDHCLSNIPSSILENAISFMPHTVYITATWLDSATMAIWPTSFI
jgi:hypothetical protein